MEDLDRFKDMMNQDLFRNRGLGAGRPDPASGIPSYHFDFVLERISDLYQGKNYGLRPDPNPWFAEPQPPERSAYNKLDEMLQRFSGLLEPFSRRYIDRGNSNATYKDALSVPPGFDRFPELLGNRISDQGKEMLEAIRSREKRTIREFPTSVFYGKDDGDFVVAAILNGEYLHIPGVLPYHPAQVSIPFQFAFHHRITMSPGPRPVMVSAVLGFRYYSDLETDADGGGSIEIGTENRLSYASLWRGGIRGTLAANKRYTFEFPQS